VIAMPLKSETSRIPNPDGLGYKDFAPMGLDVRTTILPAAAFVSLARSRLAERIALRREVGLGHGLDEAAHDHVQRLSGSVPPATP
jgi:hypothetical protein